MTENSVQDKIKSPYNSLYISEPNYPDYFNQKMSLEIVLSAYSPVECISSLEGSHDSEGALLIRVFLQNRNKHV